MASCPERTAWQSRKLHWEQSHFSVIPAKAGIQCTTTVPCCRIRSLMNLLLQDFGEK
jgi:hypothetical protein